MDNAFSQQQYNFVLTTVISDYLLSPSTSHFILLVVPLDVSNTNTESKSYGEKKTLSSTDAAPFHPD